MTQGELEFIHYETPECQADFALARYPGGLNREIPKTSVL